MDKKYQIFISSTYDDLKEQRDQVVKAVLQMGHLPVGMEMFNAGDQTQWETIKSHIDKSDYYIVLLAHRYGSTDPATGRSYTEAEYDYAGTQKVPRLGFMIEKGVRWTADFIETGPAKKKLDAFKKKVSIGRIVKFWDTADKLKYEVFASLSNEISVNPRIGWVRATESVSPQVADELARLSRENKELQDKIVLIGRNDALEKIISTLESQQAKIYISMDGFNATEYAFSLYEGFVIVSRAQFYPEIEQFLTPVIKLLKKNPGFEGVREIRNVSPLLTELYLLGLVVSDQAVNGERFWRLTDLGKQVYQRIAYHTSAE